MILTDGIIDDLNKTIDTLFEGSSLPLSFIIIDIGDHPNFENYMDYLDGDKNPLISKDGKKRQRDLVQFVPFNKFKGDTQQLAKEFLDEIPRQIIEYYTQDIYPESLNYYYNNNYNKNNNSFNE